MPKATQQVRGRAGVQNQAVWVQHLNEEPLVLPPKDLLSQGPGERKTDELTETWAGLQLCG